jgi:DNA-directed RNA polymerase subunit M/transcription elongation factor TFIIS
MNRQENIKKMSNLLELNIANKIEQSVYNFTKEYTEQNQIPFLFESVYGDKIIEIYNLLINKKSCFLIEALKKNKIDPFKIAFMRPDELNPDKYNAIIKKKEVEDFKKNNQATSSSYKCPKCKEKKCQITQKQTRAADEPATLYIECKSCGYSTIHDD